MLIGIAGFKDNYNGTGEGSGRTILALSFYYNLLQERYKKALPFELFIKNFKTKHFRDSLTPDKFIIPTRFVSDDITIKEMMIPLLGCEEKDLYDKDFICRPIKYMATYNIYRNGVKQKTIARRDKAQTFVNYRQNDVVDWESKKEIITPISIYKDLKKSIHTNIHHKMLLYKTLKEADVRKDIIIYATLENFTEFELVKSLKGTTILINNNQTKIRKSNLENKDKLLLNQKFDYYVSNFDSIDNLLFESKILLNDILNE